MPSDIPINLAVEDTLSEAVARKILRESGQPYSVGICYSRRGFGYLKKMIKPFNYTAKGMPYLVLTDLDESECPLALINEWLLHPKHPNLLFRIAVKEVESWLLANQSAFAKFLGIREELIPTDVDRIDNPKQFLVNLARESRYRSLREAIIPRRNSTAQVGPDYNGRLIYFVEKYWQVQVAVEHSLSLRRTFNTLSTFEPTWEVIE
ncbi:MAG: hypothetical protein U0401_01855 [Anaerolineae bacterium]